MQPQAGYEYLSMEVGDVARVVERRCAIHHRFAGGPELHVLELSGAARAHAEPDPLGRYGGSADARGVEGLRRDDDGKLRRTIQAPRIGGGEEALRSEVADVRSMPGAERSGIDDGERTDPATSQPQRLEHLRLGRS